MAFIGKHKKFGVNTHALRRREQLQAFAKWYAIVEFAVNYEDGCLEVFFKEKVFKINRLEK